MIKYVDVTVVFQEIPDEVTLAISISGCPYRCEECHSSYLAEDIGEELTEDVLDDLVQMNQGITCVCIMGGDSSPESVNKLCKHIKELGLKAAWYSGSDTVLGMVCQGNFDYVKIGHYDKNKGGLSSPTTNQKLFKVYSLTAGNKEYYHLNDITYKFLE